MTSAQTPVHPTFVHRRLADLVALAGRFPRVVLALALLFAAFSAFASTYWVEFRTQRSDLVSQKKAYQQRWQRYLAEFGEDDDIVVVVKGTDHARMRAALDHVASEVRGQPALFDRLFYKVDLRHLHNRALLYLPTEQLGSIRDNLKSMNLLLEFGPFSWQSLSLFSLLREARDRAGKLDPDKPLGTLDDQYLTQLKSISESAAATLTDPAGYRTPWQSLMARQPEQKDLMAEPQYFFSGQVVGSDGVATTLAFLLVRPIKETGSFTAAQKSVESLRTVVTAAKPAFTDLEFGMTGLPVLETDEMAAAQRDTRLASIVAVVGISLLFLVVYRGVSYPILTVGTLLIGTSWAMGWLALTVGHINILTASFAVMLIGMGDYGVLWVMRYEHERRLGAPVEEALRRTAYCVGTGTLTAALTTALAFYAAMLADFQAVAELGWIAGSGVLLCAFSCFTVLPALLTLFDRRERPVPVTIPIQRNTGWLPQLAGRPGWVIAGTLVLTALLGVAATRVTYDHNLLNLQAKGLDSVKWELTLIDQTAGASWHALSVCGSREEALALKARYEQLPEVSRVVEVATLVPTEQPAKLCLVKDIHNRLHNLPTRGELIKHSLPSGDRVVTELACLIGQLQPLADRCPPQSLLAELRRSLAALHEALVSMPVRRTAEERLQHFEEQMTTDLAEDLHRLRDVSTPAPVTLADLPVELRERYVGAHGKWLVQVFGKDSLWDFAPLEHFTHCIAAVDPEATGKPFATIEGLRAMKEAFQWAGVYAFAAIVFVLLSDFRDFRRTLVAIAPLALGIVLALGVMGLCGLPLNPANMIALPLILGVGVDNGVHVLHDYLAVKSEGRRMVSRSIGRGVLVKALTTMIGFGTLMISSQRGLVGLGFCLTLGVFCCMMTALVFLPAVLTKLGQRQEEVEIPSGSDLSRRAA